MKTRTAHLLASAAALFVLLSAGPLAAAPAGQSKRSGQSAPAGQRTGSSPLIEEMVALDGVIREVVSAMAQADGARLAKALEPMREPIDKTQQASRAGTLSLPRNGDRIDDFQRRHEVFQAQVDALSRAGQRNDVEAMLMITKSLLESCVSCHRTFRK